MILDPRVLVYAVDELSPFHDRARRLEHFDFARFPKWSG